MTTSGSLNFGNVSSFWPITGASIVLSPPITYDEQLLLASYADIGLSSKGFNSKGTSALPMHFHSFLAVKCTDCGLGVRAHVFNNFCHLCYYTISSM